MITFLIGYSICTMIAWILIFALGANDSGKTVLLFPLAPILLPFVIVWWLS